MDTFITQEVGIRFPDFSRQQSVAGDLGQDDKMTPPKTNWHPLIDQGICINMRRLRDPSIQCV